MANILEFLRGVLTDPEAQQMYRTDPEGFVSRSGFADLTGEDVVEAVVVVRRSLPKDVADALTDFDDEARLPAVRPSFAERDLDAALRQLDHAVALASGAAAPAPAPAATAPPPFPASTPPAAPIAAEAEPELVDPGPAADPQPTPPPHPASPPQHAPIAIEDEVELAPGALPDVPSVAALGAAIDAAAADVRAHLEDYARQVRDRLAAVLDAAERDASAIRAEAQADLDSARKVLLDARDEAARITADAEAASGAAERRLEELRDAERQLRERFAGLDDVLRTVLKEP